MSRIPALFASAVFVFAGLAPTAARQDLNAEAPHSGGLELIVVEAENCAYCYIFRRDVLPNYELSERGKVAPVLFVDVNDTATARLKLETVIDIVPTFVVTKNRVEVGRIRGYSGPENFYHAMNYLLTKP